MENKISNEVDGTNLFEPMKRTNYNWGAQSYASIEEKNKLWNVESAGKLVYQGVISKQEEFGEWYNQYSKLNNIIYRGLNNAKYKLFTSLQVHYLLNNKLSIQPREFITQEIDLLRNVNNNLYPKYFNTIGVQETDFLYLSLMQHYRAKTPFMDFSHSIDSALFFAQDGYEKSWCCNKNNPNNYVSLYWIEQPENNLELVKTINMYADSLRKAMEGIVDLYAKNPSISIDISILRIENYLKWSDPNNRGGGFKDIELGLIFDQTKKQNVNYNYDFVLQEFQNAAKAGNIAANPKLLDYYYNILCNIILYNTRLTNLNIVAQEGCFILYNPQQPFVPMEEYWVKNPAYLNLPQLHCLDIKKDLIPTCILPMLKAKGITKDYIYPIEKDIVSGIVEKIK